EDAGRPARRARAVLQGQRDDQLVGVRRRAEARRRGAPVDAPDPARAAVDRGVVSGDPLAPIDRLAPPRRAAAEGAKARWLLLSRFGFEFLGEAAARERPEEVAGLGTLRRAALGAVPVLALDRPSDQGGEPGDAAGDALAVFAAARAG